MTKEKPSIPEEVQGIIDMFDCSITEAESIYNTVNSNNRSWDETMEVLEYTVKKKTDNKVGYALTLLQKGLQKPQPTNPEVRNKFHNYEGRNYTEQAYKDLEKMLIAKNLENYEVDGQLEVEDFLEFKAE